MIYENNFNPPGLSSIWCKLERVCTTLELCIQSCSFTMHVHWSPRHLLYIHSVIAFQNFDLIYDFLSNMIKIMIVLYQYLNQCVCTSIILYVHNMLLYDQCAYALLYCAHNAQGWASVYTQLKSAHSCLKIYSPQVDKTFLQSFSEVIRNKISNELL
jgi:hypothetical protein